MKEERKKQKSTTFYSDTEVINEMEAIAKEDDVSMSQILRKLSRDFVVARRKKKVEDTALNAVTG